MIYHWQPHQKHVEKSQKRLHCCWKQRCFHLVYKSINNHNFLPLHVVKSVCLGGRAYRKACPVNTSQPSTIVVTVRADWAVTSWIFYLDVSKISLVIGMLSCVSTGFFSCSSSERMIWFKAVLFFLCRIIWQVILISNTENYVDVPCLTNRKWNDSKVMQHIRCVGFALHKLGQGRMNI